MWNAEDDIAMADCWAPCLQDVFVSTIQSCRITPSMALQHGMGSSRTSRTIDLLIFGLCKKIEVCYFRLNLNKIIGSQPQNIEFSFNIYISYFWNIKNYGYLVLWGTIWGIIHYLCCNVEHFMWTLQIVGTPPFLWYMSRKMTRSRPCSVFSCSIATLLEIHP